MKRKNRLREVGDLPKVTQQTHGGARSGLISDSTLYCGMWPWDNPCYHSASISSGTFFSRKHNVVHLISCGKYLACVHNQLFLCPWQTLLVAHSTLSFWSCIFASTQWSRQPSPTPLRCHLRWNQVLLLFQASWGQGNMSNPLDTNLRTSDDFSIIWRKPENSSKIAENKPNLKLGLIPKHNSFWDLPFQE